VPPAAPEAFSNQCIVGIASAAVIIPEASTLDFDDLKMPRTISKLKRNWLDPS